MLVKSALMEIKEKKGIGTSAMAKMLGKDLPQYVNDRLNPQKGENLSVDKLDELLLVLGYKIVLMPEEEKVKDEWYEIRGSQYETKPRELFSVESRVKKTV